MSVQGIFYITAHVTDLQRSKQFYAGKLGWKLGTNEPSVAGFHFGSGYLVLLADPDRHAVRADAGGMHVAVQVTDIEAEHARLLGLGVAVGQLLTHPWGERNFRFHDPDGYEWSFGEIRARS